MSMEYKHSLSALRRDLDDALRMYNWYINHPADPSSNEPVLNMYEKRITELKAVIKMMEDANKEGSEWEKAST